MRKYFNIWRNSLGNWKLRCLLSVLSFVVRHGSRSVYLIYLMNLFAQDPLDCISFENSNQLLARCSIYATQGGLRHGWKSLALSQHVSYTTKPGWFIHTHFHLLANVLLLKGPEEPDAAEDLGSLTADLQVWSPLEYRAMPSSQHSKLYALLPSIASDVSRYLFSLSLCPK